MLSFAEARNEKKNKLEQFVLLYVLIKFVEQENRKRICSQWVSQLFHFGTIQRGNCGFAILFYTIS